MPSPLLGALVKSAPPVQSPAPVAPPAPPAAPAWYENPTYQMAAGVAGVMAAGVSYSRNQSIPWAIAHSIVGIPYLAYVGYETATKKDGSSAVDWDPFAPPMFEER